MSNANQIRLRRVRASAFAGVMGICWLMSATAQEPAVELGKPITAQEKLLKPISEIKFENLRKSAGDEVIPDLRTLPPTTRAPDDYRVKPVMWVNANLRHRRLYFEGYCLERCGYSAEPCKQPLNSGVRFYTTAAFLPLLPFVYSPYDCFAHRVE
jgi:hypothetical protein